MRQPSLQLMTRKRQARLPEIDVRLFVETFRCEARLLFCLPASPPLPPYSHRTSYLPFNVPRFPIIPLPFCRLCTESVCEKFKVGTLSRVWGSLMKMGALHLGSINKFHDRREMSERKAFSCAEVWGCVI